MKKERVSSTSTSPGNENSVDQTITARFHWRQDTAQVGQRNHVRILRNEVEIDQRNEVRRLELLRSAWAQNHNERMAELSEIAEVINDNRDDVHAAGFDQLLSSQGFQFYSHCCHQ